MPSGVLHLVDTLVHWLARGVTLGHWLLAATAAHTHTEDDVALLGLVAETTGLVGPGGSRRAMDVVELTELPAAQTQQVAHHVALLLVVQLLHVFVGSHALTLS